MHRLDLHNLITATDNFKLLEDSLRIHRESDRGATFPKESHYAWSGEIISQICDSIDMPVTAATARRFLKIFKEIEAGVAFPAGDYRLRALEGVVDELLESFREECLSKIAFVIAPQKASLVEQAEPLFGELVSLKFAKAAADISEAGKCLALERPTACVFHLMRAAEYAVQRLGRKLRIPIDVEKESWYQISLHVNKALDALPNKSARERRMKQAIGAAAAHLNSVRIATRNDVMHPKATYTEEEAQTLFEATKALMQQVAALI